MIRPATLATIAVALLLSSCGFVHDETLVARYKLVAVDDNSGMSLCWKMDSGDCNGDGLPGPTLFAAGFNEKFIVLATHPNSNRSITRYFYIIRDLKNEDKGDASHNFGVKGPFDQTQFDLQKANLHLPEFTRTFYDLK